MRYGIAIIGVALMMMLVSASAFGQLQIVPMKYSKVKLVKGKHSVVVDLENDLAGGTLPGNPPHKYRVLFTARKDGFLFLVANVQSHSPISDPNAPCGGDSPQSVLWIKTDTTLKKREFQNEIYQSCSYNYYDSKVKVTRTALTITYGTAREKIALLYDNTAPELGLLLTEVKDKN